MEQAYFLMRKRAELKAAKSASSTEARLAHCDMAGRYSLKASDAAKCKPLRNDALPRASYFGRRRLSVSHRAEAKRCRHLAVSVTQRRARAVLFRIATLYDEMAIRATRRELRLDALHWGLEH
jgi:hypothetical protein